jgi:hypothetical protein
VAVAAAAQRATKFKIKIQRRTAMDIIENNLVTAIREIVRQELNNVEPKSDDVFVGKVETIISNSGFSLISDDVDDAIGDFLRNHVDVSINC